MADTREITAAVAGQKAGHRKGARHSYDMAALASCDNLLECNVYPAGENDPFANLPDVSDVFDAASGCSFPAVNEVSVLASCTLDTQETQHAADAVAYADTCAVEVA